MNVRVASAKGTRYLTGNEIEKIAIVSRIPDRVYRSGWVRNYYSIGSILRYSNWSNANSSRYSDGDLFFDAIPVFTFLGKAQ